LLIAGVLALFTLAFLQARDGDRKEAEKSRLPREVDTGESYSPVVIEKDLETIIKEESAQKEEVVNRQKKLLEQRYDLADRPSDVSMSGGRRKVQEGVRVKLPEGVTWEQLAKMTPQEIRSKDAWPQGFRPLPHVKHQTGGMIIRPPHIELIQKAENRNLDRFD